MTVFYKHGARVALSLLCVAIMVSCGGEAIDEEPVSGTEGAANATTDGEQSTQESPNETGEQAVEETIDGKACSELAVSGTLRVGENDISLDGASVDLSAGHTGECIASLEMNMETADGCALSLNASSLSDGGWTLTGASLDACTEDGVAVEFQSAGSTFGLLARPDVKGDGTCLDGEALALAGRLLFASAVSDVAVQLDGIVLGGGFDSEAGEGLACSPVVNSCETVSCGQDAFGMECGGCDDGTKCIDGECQVWNCPPEGPYGTAIGDTVLNLEFKDCDGNTHSLQDLCGAPAGLFNLLAGY